jgi:hypothetical protein
MTKLTNSLLLQEILPHLITHQHQIHMHLPMLLIFKAIGCGASFIIIKAMQFQQYLVANWMQKTD